MGARRLIAAMALVLATAVAGCGATPSGGNDADKSEQSSKPVKTTGFDKLGKVTLHVVSTEGSGGPRDAIKALSAQFEKKYPNVTVDVSFRDFSSWIKQVKLVLSGDNPPDVFAGNQGYQVDGTLVKAGLILPLDKYAKAYGWNSWYSPAELQQFRWTTKGQFGVGQLWGIAQSGQNTGVFVNLAKLKQAGIDPSSLKTFADFEAALKTLRAKLPSNEPVIMLGNKDQFEALHLWGMIQGAFTPAQQVRDWIFHKPGATFDTKGNLTALQHLVDWQKAGYLGDASDYNARGDADAAIAFGKGQGAFILCGNWNASTILDGLKSNAMYMNMPPGPTGQPAAIGATSTPYHISAKSKYPDLAAAYMSYINGPTASEELVKTSQVPAIINAKAQPTTRFGKELQAGWEQLVKDGGLTLFHDWASPTMLNTIGANFQEMLVGRKTPQQVASAIQKDWEDYDQQLRG
jgi:raffinose/stachyose/melibiose transport system substrate-binding protein